VNPTNAGDDASTALDIPNSSARQTPLTDAVPRSKDATLPRGVAQRGVSPDRHGCFGPTLPLAGAAWLWAGGGGGNGISTSVWRIMPISVE
jgi:hypothetical protein